MLREQSSKTENKQWRKRSKEARRVRNEIHGERKKVGRRTERKKKDKKKHGKKEMRTWKQRQRNNKKDGQCISKPSVGKHPMSMIVFFPAS